MNPKFAKWPVKEKITTMTKERLWMDLCQILKDPSDLEDFLEITRSSFKKILTKKKIGEEIYLHLELRTSSSIDPVVDKITNTNQSKSQEAGLVRKSNPIIIRPLDLLDSKEDLIKDLLRDYFMECSEYNLSKSKRVFCEYFCKRKNITIKYASIRTNSAFSKLWNEALSSLTKMNSNIETA